MFMSPNTSLFGINNVAAIVLAVVGFLHTCGLRQSPETPWHSCLELRCLHCTTASPLTWVGVHCPFLYRFKVIKEPSLLGGESLEPVPADGLDFSQPINAR